MAQTDETMTEEEIEENGQWLRRMCGTPEPVKRETVDRVMRRIEEIKAEKERNHAD